MLEKGVKNVGEKTDVVAWLGLWDGLMGSFVGT